MNMVMAAEVPEKISQLTLGAMTVSTLLLLGFSLYLILLFRNKLKAQIKEVVFGALFYFGATMLFSNVIYMLFTMIPGVNDFLSANTVVYTIANMAFTILPEIMLLAMFFRFREKDQNLAMYTEFGAGYVSLELIMVVATMMMTNLMIAGTYNSEGMEGLLTMTGAADASELSDLMEVLATPFYAYLLSAVEGILFAVIRIAYMILMYMINKNVLPKKYYGVIIGLYALVRVPSAIAECGGYDVVWVDPILIAVCVAELEYLFRLIKVGIPAEVAPLFAKKDKKDKSEKREFSFRFRKKKHAKNQPTDQGF